MSKIARNPVAVPKDVTITISGQDIKAKGPKGELSLRAHDLVTVELGDEAGVKSIKVKPVNDSREARALWGTTWALIRNNIKGVHTGFTKNIEILGVGYRANVQGKNLVLQLGYSHDIQYPIPEGIQIAVDKQTKIAVTGIDKQRVGQVSAEIRSYRKPEPYKGKGVRYEGEYINRKEGKKK